MMKHLINQTGDVVGTLSLDSNGVLTCTSDE